MTLSDVIAGDRVRVAAVGVGGAGSPERRRLAELGVRRGAVVELIRRDPFGGLLAVRVGGGVLALRADDARDVEVAEVRDDA
jgi:Fe2+ transport system protein FeoA